jgi:Spy/CpxP family protein refolding chaperone
MNLKILLRAVPAMLLCATISSTLAASKAKDAASPAASPAAASADAAAQTTAKRKVSPDAIKKARLTTLKNQVNLTADQEAKAKPIIDKYVDDREAVKGDRAKLADLKTKYDSDINAILTPEQQKKLTASKAARIEKLKAARAAKAASSASPAPSPAKSNP